MWVISITAPPLFYLTMEDPALMVSMNVNEEEPGEGEKQDCPEETLAPPETLRLQLIIAAVTYSPIQKDQVNHLDIVHEVFLPPPELSPNC